jgi:hypothetical protein
VGIEEEEALMSTTFSHVNYAPATFSDAIAREKEDFCKGNFAHTSFTLF